MPFNGSRVQHGGKSFLRADPRVVLGYHKEVHNHNTVIHEAKSDRPARVGMLVMAALLAYEHRGTIATHGGRLVRAMGGALKEAGTWAQHRLTARSDEALQIEEAKIVAPEEVPQPETPSAGARRP